jgi:hypothetical protein
MFYELGSQKCDSTYIFDYRMLYSDSLTPIKEFSEMYLDQRWGYYVDYLMGDVDNPENFIVEIYLLDDYGYWSTPMAKVCLIEKIFQMGNLHQEYKKHIDYSKGL